MSLVGKEIRKEKLVRGGKDGKVGRKGKGWGDVVVDGERVNVNVNE